MARARARTSTLGSAWEERFLDAVRKAGADKLIPGDAVDTLRRFAGVYFCATCGTEHRTESDQGRKHLRLQPRGKDGGARAKAEPLPVELTRKAKQAGAPARAKLTRATPRRG
jgi:hypothetical protein